MAFENLGTEGKKIIMKQLVKYGDSFAAKVLDNVYADTDGLTKAIDDILGIDVDVVYYEVEIAMRDKIMNYLRGNDWLDSLEGFASSSDE